jgi:hypothetical protein
VRFLPMAAAVCLSLLAVAGGLAAAPHAPAQRTDLQGTAAPGTTAPGAGALEAGAPAAASPASDAAAKHAKRTACLKNAKTKKLVGADKTSFLKACIAAP